MSVVVSAVRRGYLVLTLAPGEAREHVPARADLLVGAGRAASTLGGGRLDHVLNRAGGFRAGGVFTSRFGLGRIGDQRAHFADDEENLGLSRTYTVHLADASATRSVIAALRDLDVVESVAADVLSTAPLPGHPSLAVTTGTTGRPGHDLAWEPHARIGATAALAREPGDERIAVAVVDTGVSLGHPELQRRLLAGYDCVDLGMGEIADGMTLVGDSRGRDFSPEDDVGHGSHVAGVIGAHGWEIPPGVAGRAQVLPVRVLAAAHAAGSVGLSGVGSNPDIAQGIKIAVDLGAHVLNMSFGTPEDAADPDAPLPHQAVIRYAADRGVVLVAAAGNDGASTRFYPAAHPEVLAVGSVDAHDHRSTFSTFGDHVPLYAPGEHIVSVGRSGYRLSSGTSHAAPFVSGAAALLLSRARHLGRDLSAAEIRGALLATAVPMAEPNSPGRLDLSAALDAIDRMPGVLPVHPTTSYAGALR